MSRFAENEEQIRIVHKIVKDIKLIIERGFWDSGLIKIRGASVLNGILEEFGVDDNVNRLTYDVDLDIIDSSVRYKIFEYVPRELERLGYKFKEERVEREEYGYFSINFWFKELGIDKVRIKIDLSVRDILDNSYKVNIYEILMDKISSVSQNTVLRRPKDVFDVFIIDKFIFEGRSEDWMYEVAKGIKDSDELVFGACENWGTREGRDEIIYSMGHIKPSPVLESLESVVDYVYNILVDLGDIYDNIK